VKPNLYVDFEVTSAERYGFYLSYSVYVVKADGTEYKFTDGANGANGTFVQTICQSNDTRPANDPTGSGGILNKGLFDLLLIAKPIILTGETVELRDVLTAWGNQIQEVNFYCSPAGNPITSCDQVTPKCKYYPGTALDVKITAKPTVQLTGNPGSICAGQDAVFKVTGTSGAGVTVTLHTGSAAGPIVATYTDFQEPKFYTVVNPPASVTLYANTIKTIEQCKGESTSGTVTVNPNPVLNNPIGETKCYDGKKITAIATSPTQGATIVWYDASSGGNVVTDPSLTNVGSVTYWAEAVLGDCKSQRKSATLTIKQTPVVNSATGATECNIGQTLTATATATPVSSTITWYTTLIGTTTTTPTLSGSGDLSKGIFAQAEYQGCISATRELASLVLKEVPTVTGTTPASKCYDGTKATAQATASAGANIIWWTAATGGSIVGDPSRTIVGVSTFYAEADKIGCASTRVPVTVTIKETPTVVSVTPAAKCFDNTKATATATASDGATIVWYDAQTNGNVVADPSRTAVGTSTFWAEAVKGDCKSASRTSATVIISETPTVTGVTPAMKCYDGTKATAQATASAGATIVWYDAQTNGSVVTDPSRTIVGVSTFWAEATLGNCKSAARTSATVTIKETPSVVSTQSFNQCNSGQTLTATAVVSAGATLTWWDAATAGSQTSNTLTGVGTKTVWAQADLNGCTSTERKSAMLTIRETPTITAGPNQDVCYTGQTLTATANPSAGATVVWYDAPTGGNVVNSPTLSSVGMVTYYAEAVKERCSSTTRAAVTLKLKNCDPGYCTYTQGAFGNEGGKDRYKQDGGCYASTGATETVGDALAGWKDGKMTVAGMDFYANNSGDVALIISYLPSGGQSKVYTAGKAGLSGDISKNTLLAQTMTLGLNLGLNSALGDYELPIGTWYLSTAKSANCGGTIEAGAADQCFKFVVSMSMDDNKDGKVTVWDIWTLGNKGLTGVSTGGVSLSAIAGVADAIANAFDECRIPTNWTQNTDPCAAAKLLASLILLESPSAVNAGTGAKNLTVKAYPNPFRDRVFISFTSPVSGKATVEIFDMTGRRLEAINKGQVVAGRENTVEYTVPFANRNSIIYRVTVDKYSVNGRLISPSK
jgi:hypothetical protein